MNRLAPRLPRGLRALLVTGLLLLPVAAPSVAAAVDAVETARLMLQSGLLGAAERPRQRFVAAFETLSAEAPAPAQESTQAAADRQRTLALTVASTFPPAQVRERWLRELTARLDTEAFVAARAFFASMPGQSVAVALRAGFRDGFPRGEGARRDPAAPTDQVVLLTDAAARDLVIDVHAHAMALWATRLIAGELATGTGTGTGTAGEPSFDAAFERALVDSLESVTAAPSIHEQPDEQPDAAPEDPLQQVPAPYREAFLEFAFSDAGDRFFTTSSAALETALRQLARSQAGYFMEMVQRHPQAVPLEAP